MPPTNKFLEKQSITGIISTITSNQSESSAQSKTSPHFQKIKSTFSLTRDKPKNNVFNEKTSSNVLSDYPANFTTKRSTGLTNLKSSSTSTLKTFPPSQSSNSSVTSKIVSSLPANDIYASRPITIQTLSSCNLTEDEETLRLRDVCSKYFTLDRRTGPRPVLSDLASSSTYGSNYTTLDYKRLSTPLTINPVSPTTSENLSTSKSDSSQEPEVQYAKVCKAKSCEAPIDKPGESSSVNDHVVVVSCYENRDHRLSVKYPTVSNESPSSSKSECESSGAHDTCGSKESDSSQELVYKSSSESGRGTLKSTTSYIVNAPSITPPDQSSLDSDLSVKLDLPVVKDKKGATSRVAIEKMQQDLQRILDDSDLNNGPSRDTKLPVVHESDSWMSESSANEAEKGPKKPQKVAASSETVKKSINSTRNECKDLKSTIHSSSQAKSFIDQSKNRKETAPKASSPPRNSNYPLTKQFSMSTPKKLNRNSAETSEDPFDNDDDLSSEYTVNTSVWDMDDSPGSMKKKLSGLENMYSEVSLKINFLRFFLIDCHSRFSIFSGRA